jgi:hypothetical protein
MVWFCVVVVFLSALSDALLYDDSGVRDTVDTASRHFRNPWFFKAILGSALAVSQALLIPVPFQRYPRHHWFIIQYLPWGTLTSGVFSDSAVTALALWVAPLKQRQPLLSTADFLANFIAAVSRTSLILCQWCFSHRWCRVSVSRTPRAKAAVSRCRRHRWFYVLHSISANSKLNWIKITV